MNPEIQYGTLYSRETHVFRKKTQLNNFENTVEPLITDTLINEHLQ
jgi:hypothetical protein